MPRELIALHAQDLSAFTKALRQELSQHLSASPSPEAPSHLSLMNMLARAAGHRNLQALKAVPPPAPSKPSKLTPVHAAPARGPRHPDLSEAADRALRQFDAQGRLARWPSKRQVQRQVLWGLWLHFDSRRIYTEPEVNEVINKQHCFGDHCTLRRELVEMRLLERWDGGRQYRKLAARPDEELLPLLRELRERASPSN